MAYPSINPHEFENRRKLLGMSQSALAQRSGVSISTVKRILTDGPLIATFENVSRVAHALGLSLSLTEDLPPDEYRKQHALIKARGLVRQLQATSSLEEQGLEPEVLESLIEETVQDLLRSRRRLWTS